VLRVDASWVWDFWVADDGALFHLFFLKAPRALHPDERHRHASVGHAVSPNLVDWVEVEDALAPSTGPAFDDLAIWTGSVVRDGGGWRMLYTGIDRADRGRVQRTGVAVSDDLMTWTRVSAEPVLVADPRWYATAGSGDPDAEEFWRDPWVFADPAGDGWHLLATARAAGVPVDDGGVLAHATSRDLDTWTVRPPLSSPGAGFSQLEVPQVEVVDGRPVLLFDCMTAELSSGRRAAGERGGIWALELDDLTGPYDVGRAHLLHDESLYVGKLVRRRDGDWCLLAFRNIGPDGFVGEITDPIPVRWDADGRLALDP
jgi:beta-fructofuranosidase